MSDVPLGVYLSGGIDSSSVVAMIKNLGMNNIKTFSVGFNDGVNELPYAKKVAEFFSTEHKEFIVDHNIVNNLPKIVWHSDEPLCDPAMMPVFLLSKNAKKYVTVVLTGDGADETLAGYEQVKFLSFANKLCKIPFSKPLIKSSLNLIPNSFANKIFKYSSALGDEGKKRAVNFISDINDIPKAYNDIVSIFDNKEQFNLTGRTSNSENYVKDYFLGKNVINRVLNFETKVLLPENMLAKSDRMAMAFSIESRVPFLDKRLVDFAFSIPIKLKLNGFNDKYLLRKSMGTLLPKSITSRGKQRFYVPIDVWLKNDLSSMVNEKLSKNNIDKHGLFNSYYIEKIKNNFDNSPLFYARQLWSLLTFQIWYEEFIEKS